jgi:hypothetical protein
MPVAGCSPVAECYAEGIYPQRDPGLVKVYRDLPCSLAAPLFSIRETIARHNLMLYNWQSC